MRGRAAVGEPCVWRCDRTSGGVPTAGLAGAPFAVRRYGPAARSRRDRMYPYGVMGAGFETLIAVLGCTIAGIRAASFFSRAVAGGSPFRPSEPDPWPLGVQEDDDLRWTWDDR